MKGFILLFRKSAKKLDCALSFLPFELYGGKIFRQGAQRCRCHGGEAPGADMSLARGPFQVTDKSCEELRRQEWFAKNWEKIGVIQKDLIVQESRWLKWHVAACVQLAFRAVIYSETWQNLTPFGAILDRSHSSQTWQCYCECPEIMFWIMWFALSVNDCIAISDAIAWDLSQDLGI